MSLGYLAVPDLPGTARSMIDDMLTRPPQEAAEEAFQKVFCDKEIGKFKAIKDDDVKRKDYRIVSSRPMRWTQ